MHKAGVHFKIIQKRGILNVFNMKSEIKTIFLMSEAMTDKNLKPAMYIIHNHLFLKLDEFSVSFSLCFL